MPVLPEVPSMIVPPALSFPVRSASSIIFRAMRSLIELPGLNVSSLIRTSAAMTPRVIALTRISGVLPIAPRILSRIFAPGGVATGRSYPVAACPEFALVAADFQVVDDPLHALGVARQRHGAVRLGARRHGAVQA